MGPLAFLPAAISIGKTAVEFFRGRGKHDKASEIERALDVISGLSNEAEKDPELKKLLIQKDIEFEKDYTERVKASLDVIKTDSQSEDRYVRRARPTWLYATLIILFINFCLFPLVKIRLFDYVPVDVYVLFIKAGITGFLGYGLYRTVDKKGGNLTDIFRRK